MANVQSINPRTTKSRDAVRYRLQAQSLRELGSIDHADNVLDPQLNVAFVGEGGPALVAA